MGRCWDTIVDLDLDEDVWSDEPGLGTEVSDSLLSEVAFCVEAAGKFRRAENRAVYDQLVWVHRAWEQWRQVPFVSRAPEEGLVADLAFGLDCSRNVAGQRFSVAMVLFERRLLPLTERRLAAGDVDWARVLKVADAVAHLRAGEPQAVEALLWADPDALGGTMPAFGKALLRALDAVTGRAKAAERDRVVQDRRVWVEPRSDGSAELWAVGPVEAVAAAKEALTACARAARTAGAAQTLAQLEFDTLVTACTRGALVPPVATPAAATPAAATPAAATPSGEAPGAESVPWFTTTFPQVQPEIRVTVGLETLLGLADGPADLDGYGPIAATLARDLARNGVWRCLAVDDEHGTVLGVGRTTWTAGYAPGRGLRLLHDHASPACAVPGCGIPSRRCDLDHRVPYADGGATCSCNTAPLCRGHHRLKGAGLLRIAASDDPSDPPGTLVVTTLTGRTVRSLPHAPLRAAAAPRPPEARREEPPPPF